MNGKRAKLATNPKKCVKKGIRFWVKCEEKKWQYTRGIEKQNE